MKEGSSKAKYHRWLLEASNKRIAGDYGVDAVITPDEVARMLEQAREFVQEARRYHSRA